MTKAEKEFKLLDLFCDNCYESGEFGRESCVRWNFSNEGVKFKSRCKEVEEFLAVLSAKPTTKQTGGIGR